MNGEHTFSKLSVNLDVAATTIKTLNGIEYLVGPAKLAAQGVMNSVLYTEYELTACLKTCNGRPVVLRHSYDEAGKPVSANSPTILEKQGVGALYNTTMGADAILRAELWIRLDEIKAGKIPGMTFNTETKAVDIANGVMEISTGFFHNYYTYDGEYEGAKYKIVAYDLVLDHLALLPDETGAYSVKAGGGFPRWNSAESTLSDTHKAIKEYAKNQKAQIVCVEGNFFVYNAGGKMYKVGHAGAKGDFAPDPTTAQEVTQAMSFIAVNNEQARTTMANEPTTKVPTKDELMLAINKDFTADEILAAATSKIPHLKDALELFTNKRAELIETITKHPANQWTKDELEAQTMTSLNKLVAFVTPAAAVADESAAGDPPPNFALGGAAFNRASATAGTPTVTALDEPKLTF